MKTQNEHIMETKDKTSLMLLKLNELLELRNEYNQVKLGELSSVRFDYSQPIIVSGNYHGLEEEIKELIKKKIRIKYSKVLNEVYDVYNDLDYPLSEIKNISEGE